MGAVAVGSATAPARPIGGGAGGLVQRAWNYLDVAPYASPDRAGLGAQDGGEAAFRTLDALILMYVDNVLNTASPRTGASGSLDSGVVTGTDGVGSYTFSVAGTYSIAEATSGTFSADDTASFSFSLHESGSPPDASTFTFDESGSASLTSLGGGTSDSHTLTGSLSGTDVYTLSEGQLLVAATGSGSTSAYASESAQGSHAGTESFTYSEARTELLDGGSVTAGCETYTFDGSGTDTPSSSGSDSSGDGEPGGAAWGVESDSDTRHGTASHGLHEAGTDSFGLSAYFTSGNRDYTWDLGDSEAFAGDEGGSDGIASIPGGGSGEGDSYSGSSSGGSSASIHESGTLGYTATGGSDFVWDQSGSSTYATTETLSETTTVSGGETDSEALGNSRASESATETTSETDADGGIAWQTLHEAGAQSTSDGAVTGGSEGYTYGESEADTDTLIGRDWETAGETATDSESVAGDTMSDSMSDGMTLSDTDTDHTTGTPTLIETGTVTYGLGGVLAGGFIVRATNESGVTGDNTLDESDTATGGGTATEDDVVGGDSASESLSDGEIITDLLTDTTTPTEGDSDTLTQWLGAGGVITAGVDVAGSTETDVDSESGSETGSDTSSEIDLESDAVGGDWASESLSDGETDSVNAGLAGGDAPTMVESSVLTLGLGGIVISGTSWTTFSDLASFDPTDTDTVVDTAGGTATETDLVGGDSASDWTSEGDTITDSETYTPSESGGEYSTRTLWLGAGGAVTSGAEDSRSTETVTASEAGGEAGTDTSVRVDNEVDQTGGDSATGSLSDATTDAIDDRNSAGDTTTLIESGDSTLGAGGVVLSGTASRTLYDNGTDSPTGTDTLSAQSSESRSEGDVAGEDSLSESATETGSDTTTASLSGDDVGSGSETIVEAFGMGGVVTSGFMTFSSTRLATDYLTTTLADHVRTLIDGGHEQDNEAGADASDDQSDTETLTDSVGGSETDYPTLFQSGGQSFGAGGTITTGSYYSTLTDQGTDHEADVGSGSETYHDSLSESIAGAIDKSDETPSQGLTGSFTETVRESDAPKSYRTVTEWLDAGGWIGGGDSYESDTDTGSDSASETVAVIDLSSLGEDLSNLIGSALESVHSADTGSSSFSPSEGESDSLTTTMTASESFGVGGSILGGDESYTFYRDSGDTATSTLTTSESDDASYSGPDVLDDAESGTTTISDASSGGTTLQGYGTETLTSLGSISGGSQTLTLDTWDSDQHTILGGSAGESDTDTSSTITGTWTPGGGGGSTDSLHELEGDTWGAGGSETYGSMGYTLTYGGSDDYAPVEVGTMTIDGQVGDPSQAAGFTLDAPSSESYGSSEDGGATLGALGTITSGWDSYTWDEFRSSGVTHTVPGAGVSISETGEDTYSLHEIGGEAEGAGGSITSGSDDFTWDQSGDNDYHVSQAGYSSISSVGYVLSAGDSTSASWHDEGHDDLGPSDSIIGGTDSYAKGQFRDYSYSLSFLAVSTTSSGGSGSSSSGPSGGTNDYVLDGHGEHTYSLRDDGYDSLSDNDTGPADGSDSYTIAEWFSDSSSLANTQSGTPASASSQASDSFSMVDVGLASQSGGTSLAHRSYSIADGIGVTSRRHIYDSTSAGSDSGDDTYDFDYGFDASASDSTSDGAEVTGWFGYGGSKSLHDVYNAQESGSTFYNSNGTFVEPYSGIESSTWQDLVQSDGYASESDGSQSFGDYISSSWSDSLSESETYGSGSTTGSVTNSPLGGEFILDDYGGDDGWNSDWGDTSDGTSSTFYQAPAWGSTVESTGYDPGGIFINQDRSAQCWAMSAANDTYSPPSRSLFRDAETRLIRENKDTNDYGQDQVELASSGLYYFQADDPNGTVTPPLSFSLYRRDASSGPDYGSTLWSADELTALGDANGSIDARPRTGSGTENGLPQEDASNLSDFFNGTNREDTASADDPTTRAAQTDGKPFQDYLRWGVNGSGGGSVGSGSGSGSGGLSSSGGYSGFGAFALIEGPGSGMGSGGGSAGAMPSAMQAGAMPSAMQAAPTLARMAGFSLASSAGGPPSLAPASTPGFPTLPMAEPNGLAGAFNPSVEPGGVGPNPAGGPDVQALRSAAMQEATSASYTSGGQVAASTDALGNVTSYGYDSAGELTSIANADGDATSIAYNPAGEVVAVTDPDGNTTSYAYNTQGRLVRMTDPLGHSQTYTYDDQGRLASTTDRDGRTRTFAYDSANRLVAEDWYDAGGNQTDALRFTYNARGLLATASNDQGRYAFTYDDQGRLVREDEPFGQWLEFTYDAAGHVATVTDSSGGVTASTYDASGQLASRQLSAPGDQAIGVSFTYTPDGQVAGETRTAGGAVVGGSSDSYDASGELTGMVYVDASGHVIDGFDYTYDADGRVTSETDDPAAADGELSPGPQASTSVLRDPAPPKPSPKPIVADSTQTTEEPNAAPGGLASEPQAPVPVPSDSMAPSGSSVPSASTPSTTPGATTTYAYDASGQLIAAGSDAYSYDANGNRTNPGYVIGPDNQVLSDGTWDYTYDAEGNRIGKADLATGVSWAYGYDDADRMTSAVETDANGAVLSKVTYAYDVFGNRLEQDAWSAGATSPTVQRYAYDGDMAWADLNAQDQVTTRYLDGDAVDQLLAREDAAGHVGWYLTDRLGSVRDVVDKSGAVQDHVDYDAFGNITVETNPAVGDRYKFAGMSYIAWAGLYADGARAYDPATCRFTTEDPSGLDAGDTSVYRYVANDPLNGLDPNGLEGESPLFIWGTPHPGSRFPSAAGALQPGIQRLPTMEEYLNGDWLTAQLLSPEVSQGNWLLPPPPRLPSTAFQQPSFGDEYRRAWADMEQDAPGTIGRPGPVDGLVPIYGSGRRAINDAQNGRYAWALANAAQTGLEAFGIGALLRKGASLFVGKTAAPNAVPGPSHNAARAAALAEDLHAGELANPLTESLRSTGQLPPNYVTKAQATAAGWQPGKALNNKVPGGQIGGDVFRDPASIGLPTAPGRVWYEADIGLNNTMSRAKQPGTRLLYSNDGKAYVTPDHYGRVYPLPDWK